jgi:hypothetical protein
MWGEMLSRISNHSIHFVCTLQFVGERSRGMCLLVTGS